jgi:mannosyltransferase OCH1-like enzyme
MQNNIFQFWNSPVPPEEVSVLLQTWNAEPGCSQQLYDYDSARALIKENFEISTLISFDSCAVPAMQADFFRYCILYLKSGLYLDADTRSLAKMQELLSLASQRGILMDRRGNIANDFMFFSQMQDPLLEKVIRVAESNIKLQVSQNVWEVTGPGIMTKIFNSEQSKFLFNEISIIPVNKIKDYIDFQWEMAYKNTDSDWRNLKSKRSIFQSPPR